jgi:hypothetical protein
MSPVQYSFSSDLPSGMHRVDIEPLDTYYWLADFIQMCSFVERCDVVLSGLEGAVAGSQPWSCCINDTVLRYEPSTETVTAVFLCSNAAQSTMESLAFLTILREWRERMLAAERHRSLP